MRVKGDRSHPTSKGYLCEKALRLDYYQNGKDRLESPMRRRADGTYEAIDWDTAIAITAERLASVRDTHGGDRIFYYGGGGRHHLCGAYARATQCTWCAVHVERARAGKDGRVLGRWTSIRSNPLPYDRFWMPKRPCSLERIRGNHGFPEQRSVTLPKIPIEH